MDSEVFLGDINPSYPEGGRNYHPLSENRDFSGTEPPLDLKPVCKFPNSKIGDLQRFSKKFQIFQKFSGDEFKS